MQLRGSHLEQVRFAVMAALGRDAVVSIVVFGSYARGQQVRSSDLDVMVRGHSRLSLLQRALLDEAFEESDLPFVVDVVDFHAVDPGRRTAMLLGCLPVFP